MPNRNLHSNDRPIREEGDDLLGRGAFVKSLINSMVIDETDVDGNVIARRGTGSVIGLTGAWARQVKCYGSRVQKTTSDGTCRRGGLQSLAV
jgi:hypothetical protein